MRDSGKVAQEAQLPVNQYLLDYFRCPEEYAAYQLTGPLSQDRGYFSWDSETICYGRTVKGIRAASADAIVYDVQRDVNAGGSVSRLPFDPQEVTENLLRERYTNHFQDGRRSQSIVRKLYYLARPYLGVAIRKHLQKAHLRNWDKIQFPHWPVDCTVERLQRKLLASAMKAQGSEEVPFIWFWPEGHKSCAILSHDVEAPEGKNFCGQLMDINESFGFHTSFQVVPEVRYPVEKEFLESITSRGFEVNVHDWNHDGHLFDEHEEFLRRAKFINQAGRDFGALGFRAGILYRNAEWFDAFEFLYDMSIPNVAHLDPQRGGCCTVMPYLIGNLVEIPVTCTQDYTLFNILKDYSIDLWKQQTSMIMAQNGLMSLLVHPDYVIERRAQEVYRALLGYLAELREREGVWTPLPREVAQWWRLRSKMKLVRQSGTWRIEGEGSERARIAYAHIADGAVSYRVQDEKMQTTL